MKDANFSEFINKLKLKNDIAEVLGSYLKLERRGANEADLSADGI